MNLIEKRDYIHSHLHELDEQTIEELYEKVQFIHRSQNTVVGFDVSENPITENQLLADLEEAEGQIERGECISLEDLEKESEKW